MQEHLPFWQQHKKFILGTFWTLVFATSVLFLEIESEELRTDLLDLAQVPAFDGTSLPLPETVNFALLTAAEKEANFADIPSEKKDSLPAYDSGVFGTQVASLNATANANLVNTLTTYSVPYMGSYTLGSKEGDGSHLAVDIIALEGTPVVAVANGRVYKVSYDSGFGWNVVIEHENVPLLNNDAATIYSIYAHLSKVVFAEGQIVNRGELIGYTGNTGFSTTPHLHFQIDRANVPWHAWWPFSSSEAVAAGLSFSEAVSAGLNQQAAYENTVHPMLWTQLYLVADTGTEDSSALTEATEKSEDELNATTIAYEFSGAEAAIVNEEVTLLLTAEPVPSETIELQVSGSATLDPNSLDPTDFAAGEATLTITNTVAEKIQITLADSTATHEIDFLTAAETEPENLEFCFDLPEVFLTHQENTITVKFCNEAGEPISATPTIGNLTLNTTNQAGTFTPNHRRLTEFENGAATFILDYPSLDSFQIQAKVAATAETDSIQDISPLIEPQPFSDISNDHAQALEINYLKEQGIIQGNPDGTYDALAPLNRVAFLKILIEAELPTEFAEFAENFPAADATSCFPDAQQKEWYTPYLCFAKAEGIITGYADGTVGPNREINFAEAAKIASETFASAAIQAAKEEPAEQKAWYEPYLEFLANNNILPTDYTEPNAAVTRGQFAVVAYRFSNLAN